MPGSFLVQAKDSTGESTQMMITPGGVTAVTAPDSGTANQNSNTVSNSSELLPRAPSSFFHDGATDVNMTPCHAQTVQEARRMPVNCTRPRGTSTSDAFQAAGWS